MHTYIGKQRALSLDIWISPSMCMSLGERQCVALLRSAWENYKCLNVQITYLWVSVLKWLATRNPKLFVMGSNQIRRLFCNTFFFNSRSTHFSFFVFLSLFRCYLLLFFSIIFSLIYKIINMYIDVVTIAFVPVIWPL